MLEPQSNKNDQLIKRPINILALAENIASMWDHLDELDERKFTGSDDSRYRFILKKIHAVYDEKDLTEKLICNTQAHEAIEGLLQLIMISSIFDLLQDITHGFATHLDGKPIGNLTPEQESDLEILDENLKHAHKAVRSALRILEGSVPEKSAAYNRVKDVYAADYTYPFDDFGEDDYEARLKLSMPTKVNSEAKIDNHDLADDILELIQQWQINIKKRDEMDDEEWDKFCREINDPLEDRILAYRAKSNEELYAKADFIEDLHGPCIASKADLGDRCFASVLADIEALHKPANIEQLAQSVEKQAAVSG